MNKSSEELLNEIPKDVLWRINRLTLLGQLVVINGMLKISGKYAAKFYMQNGVPLEFLEDWVNNYIKTGNSRHSHNTRKVTE